MGRELETNSRDKSVQDGDQHADKPSPFTWSGAWRIGEDAVTGAAHTVGTEFKDHPLKATGEVLLGAAAVTATVIAAPEIAAGSAAAAAAVGIGEAGADLVAGLTTAAWLTLPYARTASHLGADTVNGINNTTDDRKVLMHPEAYDPARVAQADASVQENLGVPTVETLAIAGGMVGTAYSGAPLVAPIRAGAVPTVTDELPPADTAGQPPKTIATAHPPTEPTAPAEALPQSAMLQHPWLPDYRLPPELEAQPVSTLPGGKADFDAVVIGNGIGGLTTAHAIADFPWLRGSRVGMVSSGEIGELGNSTAMMMRTRIIDGDYQEHLNAVGPDGLNQLLTSSENAYSHMSNLLGDSSHPTDSYYFSWTDSDATPDPWLRTSLKPLTQVPGVRYLTPSEAGQVQPFMTGALKLEGEAHIDPVEALHKIASDPTFQDNVKLLKGTVTGVTRDADGLIRLTTADGGQITTRSAFFATNSPPPFLGNPGTFPDFEPRNGTTLLTRAPLAKLGTANYYDTEDITFFRNVTGADGKPLLRIGGNAPDTPTNILGRLDPTANILRRTDHELMLSPDGRPIIDQVPGMPGVYVNLGFNGTGTLGAGMGPPILRQLLRTGIHPSAKLFGANREFVAIRPEPEAH
jgi:glycine/D-amino acid oxidase-like deaminating enzyme